MGNRINLQLVKVAMAAAVLIIAASYARADVIGYSFTGTSADGHGSASCVYALDDRTIPLSIRGRALVNLVPSPPPMRGQTPLSRKICLVPTLTPFRSISSRAVVAEWALQSMTQAMLEPLCSVILRIP